MADALGIDIGGSGIKGAPVDPVAGTLLSERVRIPTPSPATPDSVGETVAAVVNELDGSTGSIGCTFPGIVLDGVVWSAANVDDAWIGVDASAAFSDAIGREVVVLNDADAAGIAEARFGAARGVMGTAIILTLGTGIGSAVLRDGLLVPNTELGHLEVGGVVAESFASSRVRKDRGMSFTDWGGEVNRYLAHVERLFSPDLLVLGGGVSKYFDEFASELVTRARVVPAALGNEAGIVGAAVWSSGGYGRANSS